MEPIGMRQRQQESTSFFEMVFIIVLGSVVVYCVMWKFRETDKRIKELERVQPQTRTPNTPPPSQPDAGH